jgi:hypothetical protein
MKRSKFAISRDKDIKAQKPGKRAANKNRETYYEYRENRTDSDLRKKLEWGGTAESSETGAFIGGVNASSMYKKGGGIGSYKGVMIGDYTVLDNPGITLYNKDSARLIMIPEGPYSYYGGAIYRFVKNGIMIYIMPQRKTDGSGKYNSVFWYESNGKNEGNLKNIEWGGSNAYKEFKKYEKNKDWESIAKIFEYIFDSEGMIKNDKFEIWYQNFLKNPEIEKLPASEKTRIKLAPTYFMYKMQNGGQLNETFPSNDAMSYKTGGGVGKYEKLVKDNWDEITYSYETGGSKLPKTISSGDAEGFLEEFDDSFSNMSEEEQSKAITKFKNAFKSVRTTKMEMGGSTKGFEYSIGGL